jgi:hypothetical protein
MGRQNCVVWDWLTVWIGVIYCGIIIIIESFNFRRFFMAGTAQIDRIISEVNDLEENEKILFFHRIEEIFGNSSGNSENDDIPIESVFGLWKYRNITKDTLRRKTRING